MKKGHLLFLVLLALYFGVLVVKIYTNCNIYQWDFKTHYYAAEVAEAGLNFYDRPLLRRFARSPVQQYYSYPPFSIWFYRIFSLFNFRTGYTLFLLIKCLMLGGLVILWQKTFLPARGRVLFFAFLLFAFNGALVVDFTSGNISLLEQFLLWWAFFFFLKRKPLPFCTLVLLASTFKIIPLFFLVLLPLSSMKRKYLYFLGTSAVWGLLQGISYLMDPMLFGEFLKIFRGMVKEWRGITNPSTYVFLNNIAAGLREATGITLPPIMLPVVFGIVVSIILKISWDAYRRLRSLPEAQRNRLLIFLVCLVYALILPRFKDYSYTLLLVPAFYCLIELASQKGPVFFFILMLLTIPGHANPPGFEAVSRFLWDFYPLFLAYLIWGLVLNEIFQKSGSRPLTQSRRSSRRR